MGLLGPGPGLIGDVFYPFRSSEERAAIDRRVAEAKDEQREDLEDRQGQRQDAGVYKTQIRQSAGVAQAYYTGEQYHAAEPYTDLGWSLIGTAGQLAAGYFGIDMPPAPPAPGAAVDPFAFVKENPVLSLAGAAFVAWGVKTYVLDARK
jgi:hypothetical protein